VATSELSTHFLLSLINYKDPPIYRDGGRWRFPPKPLVVIFFRAPGGRGIYKKLLEPTQRPTNPYMGWATPPTPSSACCSRPALILPEARGGRHGDIPCLSWSGAEKRGAYRPTVERRRGGGAGAPAGLRRQWRKSRGLVNLRSRARPPSLLLPCSDG
jgi:hypothetical protein